MGWLVSIDERLSDSRGERTRHIASARRVTFGDDPIKSAKPGKRLTAKVGKAGSLFMKGRIEQVCDPVEVASNTWSKLEALVAVWEVISTIWC